MQTIHEPAKQVPVIATPDVLVVGGGPAGVAAALSAARNGMSVMLLERYGFLGGNATNALINPLFTFHDISGRQVVLGIAEEIVQRLKTKGGSVGHVTDLTFDNASMTPFDPEVMKIVLFEMMEEANVQLLLHTWAVDVLTSEGKITAVVIENKNGRQAICPEVVIDCTGDADIAIRAGASYYKGRDEDGGLQPASMFFRIGGVDFPRLRSWMKANRHLLKDSPTDEEIDSQEAIAFLGLRQLVKQAMEAGDYPPTAAPRILFYQLPGTGQVAVNASRLQKIDGTSAMDLTQAEIEGRKQAWWIHSFLQKYVGGFEDSFIVDTAAQVGVRETRRIVGDYTLDEKDVLAGRSFPDGIACGTFAIDIHPPEGEEQVFTGSGKAVYEIPYRCCLPQGLDNVLVAGRCISVTHEAFGSIRVMATCMAVGQGVGLAAAMAVQAGGNTRAVDTDKLVARLIDQGQFLLKEGVTERVDPELRMHRQGGSGEIAGHHNPFECN